MLENRKFHIFLAGAGLLVFGTAVAWFGIIQQQRPIKANASPENWVEQQSEASIRREGPERGAPRPDRFDEAPSFDVIRIEPTGEAVIAGRSAPGATVRLLRDGKTYAETVADNSGFFALVPAPLPPGPQSVILQTIGPDGGTARVAGHRHDRPQFRPQHKTPCDACIARHANRCSFPSLSADYRRFVTTTPISLASRDHDNRC